MTKVPEMDPVIGHPDEKKLDFTGVDTRLPMFAYVSREKRPGYDHNKKAGAMNAMVRASAVLSNGPFILNLDCDHYIYNSLAIREGMCFMMDRGGDRICYIQFPQRFEGIDPSDRYANHNTVFFDGNLINDRDLFDYYTMNSDHLSNFLSFFILLFFYFYSNSRNRFKCLL